MTRLALPCFCLILFVCGLISSGCAVQQAAGGAAPQTVTIKSTTKSAYEKKSVGGGALYTFRYVSHVLPLTPEAEDIADDQADESETENDEMGSATAACQESSACGCGAVRDGEAGLVFYPEAEVLRVEWKQMRGLPGPFDVGTLARDGNGVWSLISAPTHEGAVCVVENVESDQLDRFLGFTLRCKSEDLEQACRLEEVLSVRFVSPLDALPQSLPVKEFPLLEDQSPAPSGS